MRLATLPLILLAALLAVLVPAAEAQPSKDSEAPKTERLPPPATCDDGEFVVVDGRVARYDASTGFLVAYGDIVVGDARCKGDGDLETRGFAAGTPWPGGLVYFEILSGFTPDGVQRMYTAMDKITNTTPLTFIEIDPANPPSNYIKIRHVPTLQAAGQSQVGMAWSPQFIDLKDEGVITDTFTHELMHAVGFHHEHNRPDREQFITIPASAEQACTEQPTWPAVVTPYDYNSNTHYETDLCDDMVPTSFRGVEIVGGPELSAYDRRSICIVYDAVVANLGPTCEAERTAVIPGSAGCPTDSVPFTITQPTTTDMAGWVGQWEQSGSSRTMALCEVQAEFRNLRSSQQTSSSVRADNAYAVVALTRLCPPGAQWATLFAEGTTIEVTGLSASPSSITTDDTTELGVCVFRSASDRTDEWTMDGFPDLGVSYGVLGDLPGRALDSGLAGGIDIDDGPMKWLNGQNTALFGTGGKVHVSEVTGTRPELDVTIDSVASETVSIPSCQRHLTIQFHVDKPTFITSNYAIEVIGSGNDTGLSFVDEGLEIVGTATRQLGCTSQAYAVTIRAKADTPYWPTFITGQDTDQHDPCGNVVMLTAGGDSSDSIDIADEKSAADKAGTDGKQGEAIIEPAKKSEAQLGGIGPDDGGPDSIFAEPDC